MNSQIAFRKSLLCASVAGLGLFSSAAFSADIYKLSNNQRIACSRGLTPGKLKNNGHTPEADEGAQASSAESRGTTIVPQKSNTNS